MEEVIGNNVEIDLKVGEYTAPFGGDVSFNLGGKGFAYYYTWNPNTRLYDITLEEYEEPGATRYLIQVLNEDGSVFYNDESSVSTQEIKNLLPENSYTLKIQGVASGELLEPFPDIAVTLPGVHPDVVVNVTTEKTVDSLTFSWSAPEGAVEYEKQLEKDGIAVMQEVSPGEVFHVSGLDEYTEYAFKVIAINELGESEQRSFTETTVLNPPNAPFGLNQTDAFVASYRVTWSVADVWKVDVVEAKHVNKDGVVSVYKGDAFFTNRVFKGSMLSGTTESVSVRSGNAAGWSAWSTPLVPEVEAFVEPDSVLGLLAGAQQPDIQRPVNWTGNDSGNKGTKENIGLSASLLMFHFMEEETSQLPYKKELGNVSNEFIGSPKVTNVSIFLGKPPIKLTVKEKLIVTNVSTNVLKEIKMKETGSQEQILPVIGNTSVSVSKKAEQQVVQDKTVLTPNIAVSIY